MAERPHSPIRIGTRGSRLALWQAGRVRDLLRQSYADLEFECVAIATSGDRVADRPIAHLGGKGVFTREIEEALLAERIDLAVHSLKDLPTALPAGLAVGAVCEREDPSDVFVTRADRPVRSLADLREGAVVATGSPRRRAQLLHLRPDIQCVDIRGNVDTRLRKLDESDWDGLILARAGLVRLGLADRIAFAIDPADMLPAVGQGALAVEIREGDARIGSLLNPIHHLPTHASTVAERAFLHRLGGGCSVPIAALGTVSDGGLRLEGLVASPDGQRCVRDRIEGETREASELGCRLAERLLDAGSGAILKEFPNG
ncbi:hydroxymethylbilane synthase [Candidatus Sumerlaeota bacterium]|nr:hydroxymethylbilane synthase [Candidatus Sumerlaeota bacterium]